VKTSLKAGRKRCAFYWQGEFISPPRRYIWCYNRANL